MCSMSLNEILVSKLIACAWKYGFNFLAMTTEHKICFSYYTSYNLFKIYYYHIVNGFHTIITHSTKDGAYHFRSDSQVQV